MFNKALIVNRLLVCAILLAVTGISFASTNGISGYSMSATGSNSCHTCHTVNSSDPSPINTLSITGASNVVSQSTNSYSVQLNTDETFETCFFIFCTDNPYTNAGFNLSANNGTLFPGASDSKIINSQLVHSAAKSAVNTGGGNYRSTWNFNYTAPVNAGSYTLSACAMPTDGSSPIFPAGAGTDGHTVCTTKTITVTAPPTANAGTNQLVLEGVTVNLSGSGTGTGTLTYAWSQLSGSAVTLSGANTQTPSFTAPQAAPGTPLALTFRLTVTDSVSSATSQVIINVQDPADTNTAPVANAGPNQSVNEGSVVNLSGLGSTDAEDGVPASYAWINNLGLVINGANTATPSFTAPQVSPSGALITFTLTVTDSFGVQDTDTVTVNVNNVDNPPVAIIQNPTGSSILANAQVTLFSFSSDPDGPIQDYQWMQTAGPAIINPGPNNQPQFQFTAPASGVIAIQLTVTGSDGASAAGSDFVIESYDLADQPPVANAGPDQIAVEGENVVFDGSLSSDPNSNITGYKWQQINCTQCLVLGTDDAAQLRLVAPGIMPDENGIQLELELTGTDEAGQSSVDTVLFTINDNGITNGFDPTLINYEAQPGQLLAIEAAPVDTTNDIAGFNMLQAMTSTEDATDPDNQQDPFNNTNRPAAMPEGISTMEVAVRQKAGGAGLAKAVIITMHFRGGQDETRDIYQYLPGRGWINSSKAKDFDDLEFIDGKWTEITEPVYFNNQRSSVQVQITDGGLGDMDQTVNGIVTTKFGAGEIVPAVTSQAGASGALDRYLIVALFLSLLAVRIRRISR